MKKYKHIFFDLDRTLWDYERNSLATFEELYEKYNLSQQIPSPGELFNAYYKHNEELWNLLRKGKIKKEELKLKRFIMTLADFGIKDDTLAGTIGDDYLTICSEKSYLVQGAIDVLKTLKCNHFLYILTNGFYEVQIQKLENSGLREYFDEVITSESAGIQKPSREIFEFAIRFVRAIKEECLMVGDDLEVDIMGARNAGMDQVYFNRDGFKHKEKVSYEISSLNELLALPGILI